MTNVVSPAAVDLIVEAEVGSRAQYEQHYAHPEWPQGASGVTIGIGYDVGYCASIEALKTDWKGLIPDAMIAGLAPAIGVKGKAAAPLARELRTVVKVPWDAAIAVFRDVDVPRWAERCRKLLPNFDALPADCRGALVSLAYNRGASFTLAGDRYREMRAIRAAMRAKDYRAIPAQFRSMTRLWRGQGLAGLVKRREDEAKLFERGLTQMAATAA
jgi:hypothetical protein